MQTKKLLLMSLIIFVVAVGGLYFFQQQKSFLSSPEVAQRYYSKQGFSFLLPKGYGVAYETKDGLKIIRMDSTTTTLSEMIIAWDNGGVLDLPTNPGENQIIKEQPIVINGVAGKKYSVVYPWLSKTNEYPRYRLENKKVIYDMALFDDNFNSIVFEKIIKSFLISD